LALVANIGFSQLQLASYHCPQINKGWKNSETFDGISIVTFSMDAAALRYAKLIHAIELLSRRAVPLLRR
jgi:hypothetical protein